MLRPARAVLLLVLAVAASGCGGRSSDAEPLPAASGTPSRSETPTPAPSSTVASPASTTPPAITTSAPAAAKPPCDPGGGFPRPRRGCPDPTPETGWITASPDGRLRIQPFHTYTDDAEGRAYARAHHLEFPFPNDYLDAATGAPRPLPLAADTVCTGIIRVGYREPLADHVVDCREFLHPRSPSPVPAALWSVGGRPVQLSELYRP